jgi:DUF2075 family protein/phage repressor protein C with HTH and peptisase S24 domain
MIVYQSTKVGFLEDASNCIEDIVRAKVKEKLNIDIQVGSSEYNSWKNSLGDAMYKVMQTDKIPNDAGVAIEYAIPRAKNRIDFIITGEDDEGKEKVVIIELKQWTDIQKTDKDGVVITRFKSGPSEEPHPSYQAWSYSSLLCGFNTVVYEEKIGLEPCAYLHNHIDDDVILSPFYQEYLGKAPAFCKGEKEKLQDFIAKFVKHGEKKNTLYRIDNGEIRPSKNLADSLSSMLKGNTEFVLIDEQKIVYETALSLTKKSSKVNKNVLIVEGGPGTGKSVVAINLLVAITKLGLNTQYVTKNAAPRGVFEAKLTGSFKKSEISNFFTGSGSFIDQEQSIFDALIVDEAHRLNGKSGMFKNLGENQIKEIIESAKCSVFFIDEDQKVTWHDIGRKEAIEEWANKIGAKTQTLKLESQFRCNGSDGYLSWLDDVLDIKETANNTLDGINYDFKIVDSPNELRDLIFKKNEINNSARIVAGYCWNWVSKKDKNLNDIIFPEYNFGMKWNLASDGNIWIISLKSVNEIGCIHTCQGLEVDYIGVIVGEDFVVRNGEVITDTSKRAKTDASLKGYKRDLRLNADEAEEKADAIIKNTYRTLMTRGMKGCYVYFVDKETENYFRSRIGKTDDVLQTNFDIGKTKVAIKSPYAVEMVGIPLVGSAPCGEPLLGENNIEEMIMVDKSKIRSGAKYFILRADGDSMNLAGINDGDLVLCRYSEKGETGDRVVALLGGENVTIKYYDKKDGLRILLPKSTNKTHYPIIPEEGDSVQGIVQEVIKRINQE